MEKLKKATLVGLTREMASFPWGDAELDELVDPKLGVITGMQDVLDQLEQLRKVDLVDLPPAGAVRPDGGRRER